MIISTLLWILYAYASISTVFTTVFVVRLYQRYKEELRIESEIKRYVENYRAVTIEPIKDQFYMFDSITDEFLGQSSTKKQLLNDVEKRFPNLKLIVSVKKVKKKQGVVVNE